MAKTKNKRRPAQKKTQVPAAQKSGLLKKNETQATENKNSITQFLLGHPVINKKDIIEISIMIILIAFLIFMDLKIKEII